MAILIKTPDSENLKSINTMRIVCHAVFAMFVLMPSVAFLSLSLMDGHQDTLTHVVGEITIAAGFLPILFSLVAMLRNKSVCSRISSVASISMMSVSVLMLVMTSSIMWGRSGFISVLIILPAVGMVILDTILGENLDLAEEAEQSI